MQISISVLMESINYALTYKSLWHAPSLQQMNVLRINDYKLPTSSFSLYCLIICIFIETSMFEIEMCQSQNLPQIGLKVLILILLEYILSNDTAMHPKFPNLFGISYNCCRFVTQCKTRIRNDILLIVYVLVLQVNGTCCYQFPLLSLPFLLMLT